MTEMSTAMESVLALQQGLAASDLVGKTAQYTLTDGTTGSGTVLSASFGVASQAEPTVRIGDKDIPLSSITTVGTPR
jgi:flagellar basal-body rod modification protein FlgD